MSLGDGNTRWESNDPEIFLATDDLELVGKSLAQTLMMGRHRGIRQGQGVEFHTHRSYEPGDDLRHINWRLFARQHRLYTRESRRELQRPCHILCDTSRSMAVAHGKWSKHAYAVSRQLSPNSPGTNAILRGYSFFPTTRARSARSCWRLTSAGNLGATVPQHP